MKKFFSVSLSLMLMVSMFAVNAFATRDLTYTAPNALPKIDGTAEKLWDNAEWTKVDLPFSEDTDTYGGHALRVKLMWDKDALYLLGEMTCPTLDTCDDIIEVYIDELGDKTAYGTDDMQVGFGKDGVKVDYGTNNRSDECEAVSTKTETGYLTEAKISWSGEAPIAENNTLGLEFMANIQPDGAFKQAFRWNVDTAAGDEAPWVGTGMWGTLKLGAAPAADAPVVDAPATETPDDETAEAPQTGDASAIVALLAVAAIGTAVVVTKKSRA